MTTTNPQEEAVSKLEEAEFQLEEAVSQLEEAEFQLLEEAVPQVT